MKRKDFLKLSGLAGVVAALPAAKVASKNVAENAPTGGPDGACTLIPSETAGPFPLDLTANQTFFRQDLRETKTGTQLNLKMKIIGADNCLPMQNVRVNIWACDKDGNYSGYQTEVGKTYLRGYQMTDANGECEFITIFPGWYTGRICHIHFQCYVSSIYAAISQLTFPLATKNALYAANSGLYTKGADPLNFNTDNIFSDGYAYQLATLTPNAATGGYDSYLEVTIKGSGISGLAEAEPETGGQFKLGQNFPNPYFEETSVPFKLTNRSNVALEIWDLSGKKVGEILKNDLLPGGHEFLVNLKLLGLPNSNFAYQLVVQNENGTFRQSKMMTAGK